MRKNKKVIFNADDFGYSRGVNLGIIDAHRDGVLSSTTIMANMPGFIDAVQHSKENPDLGIGVHLTLTCGKPVLNTVKTLTENGRFHNLTYYQKKFEISYQELYQEWHAQISKVIDAGISPTHLDSHHHVNSIEGISDVFCELAREFQLPVRNNFNVPSDIQTTDYFYTEFDSLGQSPDIWKPMLMNNLSKIYDKFDVIEIMCHPGYVDATLLEGSSYTEGRTYVVNELLNHSHQDLLNDKNVSLATYGMIGVDKNER